MELTTFEASKKYKLSTGYLRLLLGRGEIKGRQAQMTSQRKIWLIDEKSIKNFLKKDRKPGRPPKNG